MKFRVFSTVFLAVLSTFAVGQIDYGPRGISTTLPMAPPAAPPVITPSANTIPITPSVNPLVITPPLTTIPLVQAVPPPIEPSPTERMANALKYAYSSNTEAAEPPRGRGVSNAAPAANDGTGGRTLGEIAREKRRCTPDATELKFTNDDFARTVAPGDTSAIPSLVKSVCPK